MYIKKIIIKQREIRINFILSRGQCNPCFIPLLIFQKRFERRTQIQWNHSSVKPFFIGCFACETKFNNKYVIAYLDFVERHLQIECHDCSLQSAQWMLNVREMESKLQTHSHVIQRINYNSIRIITIRIIICSLTNSIFQLELIQKQHF